MSEGIAALGIFDPSSHWNKASSTPPVTAPVPAPFVAPPSAPVPTAPVAPSVAQLTAPVAPPVAQPPVPVAVPQVPIPPTTSVPLPPIHESDDDDSEEESFGNDHVLKFGERLSRYPISRFKGVQGQANRVAILTTDRWYSVKTHYLKGLGSFYCFDTTCCESGDAAVRYLAPIVEYATDREGSLIQAPFTIKYLSLADDAYNNLVMMSKSFPLNQVDLMITCQDSKFQKLTYQLACAPGQATWLQTKEFAGAVWNKYQSLDKHILRSFAKSLGKTQAEKEAVYARLNQKNLGVSAVESAPGAVPFNMAEYLKQRGG